MKHLLASTKPRVPMVFFVPNVVAVERASDKAPTTQMLNSCRPVYLRARTRTNHLHARRPSGYVSLS